MLDSDDDVMKGGMVVRRLLVEQPKNLNYPTKMMSETEKEVICEND